MTWTTHGESGPSRLGSAGSAASLEVADEPFGRDPAVALDHPVLQYLKGGRGSRKGPETPPPPPQPVSRGGRAGNRQRLLLGLVELHAHSRALGAFRAEEHEDLLPDLRHQVVLPGLVLPRSGKPEGEPEYP